MSGEIAPSSAAAPTVSTDSEVIHADYGPHAPSSLPSTPTSSGGRFLYFAYGSNLLPSMLALKHVSVHSSRAGYLQDVQLLFDLRYPSLIEPCYANLQRQAGARTHGVVYEMDARDLATMDRFEGGGRSYVREEFEVCLYGNVSRSGDPADEADDTLASNTERITAWAYICHPNNMSRIALSSHPPSERYLSIIRRGARHHSLDPAYIDWLDKHPFTPLPELVFTPEQLAAIESRTVTEAELASHGYQEYMDHTPVSEWRHPLFLAVKGVVFDIRGGKFANSWKRINSGKDLTLYVAGRVAVDAHTIPHDISQLKPEHQAYINATLVDYAEHYKVVGHMEDRHKFNF